MHSNTHAPILEIRSAQPDDCNLILAFIKELADYERLSHEVEATAAMLQKHLFGAHPLAEVLIGEVEGNAVGYALFFHNFSTFTGKPGIYLEDIYVRPDQRSRGYGKALLAFIAKLALERQCGRLEWSVLNWNTPAIDFYRSIGAVPMDAWTVQRMTGDAIKKLAAS